MYTLKSWSRVLKWLDQASITLERWLVAVEKVIIVIIIHRRYCRRPISHIFYIAIINIILDSTDIHTVDSVETQ